MNLYRWTIQAALLVVVAQMPQITSKADDSPNGGASNNLERTVSMYLQQLDSDSRQSRVQAEKQLLAIGPKVLPLLPAPELLPNVSVRAAVRRIRIKLEQRKARESILPAYVTLKGTASLDNALRQFAKQTGNRIDQSELAETTRTQLLQLDFDRRPFWLAMDSIARQAKLQLQFGAGADGLQLTTPPIGSVPANSVVAYAGAFRISAEAAALRPIFGDDEHRLLPVYVQLACEPRLRPLFLSYSPGDFIVKADKNTSFPPRSPGARLEIPLGEGGRHVKFKLDFNVPADNVPADNVPADNVPAETAVSKVSLQGKLKVKTAAGTERIVFANLPQSIGVSRRRGGVTVNLQKAVFQKSAQNKLEAKVRVAVSYDFGGPAFESHRTWIYHNEVYLESPGGRRVEYSGFDTPRQGDGVIVLEYKFEQLKGLPAQFRFVYLAPTLIIDVPVEFQIPNIPLAKSTSKGSNNERSRSN